MTIRATNAFSAGHIVSTWQVRRGSNRSALNVEAHFPSYGTGGTITAVTTGGRSVRLTAANGSIDLSQVAYFWVKSAGPETGYVVVPRSYPSGASTEVVKPSVQQAAPLPGPTLVIQMARSNRSFKQQTLQVAIGIAATAADAAAAAKTLGAKGS